MRFKEINKKILVIILLVLFAFIVTATDTTLPDISFVSQTPQNASSQTGNSLFINISSSDDSGDHYVINNFDSSLVLWMRMDDTNSSGDPTDLSSYSNNGTRVNAIINSTNGYWGNGTYFAGGTGGYISLPISSSLNLSGNFTICAWINPAATDSVAGIVKRGLDSGGNAANQYLLRVSNAGALIMIMGNSIASVSSLSADSVITSNVWQHVCGKVNETNQMVLYKNGTEITETVGTNSYIFPYEQVQLIGAVKTTANTFNGSIDEVLIFNRSLSNQEILALYNATANQYYHNF
ncbi:MAG: LamG domain-containing protein, partial [Nanoarchaeota archaeon]|nr:LamG domain-containing protein [Nanoarchaeota archaeon]